VATTPSPSAMDMEYKMTGGTGSYLYMAGEIFRHEPYNGKADVYSFAMIFYEMVALRRPFRGVDPIRAAMRAATDALRPDWPLPADHFTVEERRLLPEVQQLAEKCWAPSPRDRCCKPRKSEPAGYCHVSVLLLMSSPFMGSGTALMLSWAFT
jgi:serine/threonine protein kinase